ncbi:MAG TPA: hypothetical protein ENJ28_07055 [Gammaproteobacteria bacterium]|nr:hypothetical protein [Gammaproteobacteria bacterium]
MEEECDTYAYFWVSDFSCSPKEKGKEIPGNLVFNIKDLDHPLLNVSKKMSVMDMTALLTKLADLMEPCDVKIGENGKIIEKYPGALSKVSNE